jgi:hypothetical protein
MVKCGVFFAVRTGLLIINHLGEPTFTRRTTDHCLGNCVVVNLNLNSTPPRPVKCSVSRYFPTFSSLLPLALFES